MKKVLLAVLAALALSFPALAQLDQAVPLSSSAFRLDGGSPLPVGYLTIQDEGGNLNQQAVLNFVGAGVTCADDAGNFRTNCTIGSASGYATVQDEGINLTQRQTVNFIGSGVTCADNAGSTRTDCTITTGGAPTGATYITQTPDGTLSAEQAMSLLGTGLVKNTTATGVLSIYGGTSCTNQFARSLDASGAATCNSVADSDLTGTVGVSHGGTGISSGTSGGIPYFSGTGSIASSALLSAQGIVVGGGAGAAPSTVAIGTDGQRPYSDGTNLTFQDVPAITKELVLFDDWSGGQESITSTGSDIGGWTEVNASGGTAGCTAGSGGVPDANHPGIQCLNISTTASSSALLHRRQSWTLKGGFYWSSIVRIPNVSDATDTFTVQIGLGNNATTADPAHGCWFAQNSGVNSGNWTLNCANNGGGTVTTNSSTAPASNTWYTLEIVVNSGATSVDFRVNGSSIGTVSTVPTSTSSFCGSRYLILRTAGSTNPRALQIDTTKVRIPVSR